MSSPDPFAQSAGHRFDDPAVEEYYQRDRAQRDALRACRLQVAIALMALVMGALITIISLVRHTPVSFFWIMLRFGVIVPLLLASSYAVLRPWGQRHLQLVLGLVVGTLVGTQALGWFGDWVPGMSMRALWLVPVMTLWAAVMTLPLSARAVVFATSGTLTIAQTGILFLVPDIDLLTGLSTAFAFVFCGFGLVLFSRWRERDHRELFIHRRKTEQLAEKLSAQNQTLVQLNQQRDEFVAGVLHDLRSPVTGVLLTADMLRTHPTIPLEERDRLLGEMAGSARRIDEFATHFLEQRSLERAADDLRLATVPLGPAVLRAVERARLAASRKQQQIQIDPPVPPDVSVVVDELLFDRALCNLLDNAVKFSPLGLTITVQATADPTASDRVRVLVTDPGPGISAADQPRLFQPYTRLGHKGTAGEPSTGLGLALLKQWIDAMGGTVGCDSEPRRGSTFWVAVRRAAPAV